MLKGHGGKLMKCKCVLSIVLALRNTMQILQKQGDLALYKKCWTRPNMGFCRFCWFVNSVFQYIGQYFFFLRGTYLHNICCVLFIYSFMLCPTLLGSVVLVAFQRFYQRCSLSSQGWTNYAMLTLITWVIGVYPIPFFLKFHLLDDINADGDWLDQLVRL